jgi:RNA polymerase sigma-70 factor, ECF subfamily
MTHDSDAEPEATDAALFDRLFREHGVAIFRFCLRRTGDPVLADDHRSTVFFEAWRRRGEIDLTTRPALPWLYGVAANVIRNDGRAYRRRQAALRRIPIAAIELDTTEDITSRIDASGRAHAALELLGTLPARERDVVLLCLARDLSYEAAADALDLPVGTIRSRLSRARTRLRVLAGDEHL